MTCKLIYHNIQVAYLAQPTIIVSKKIGKFKISWTL